MKYILRILASCFSLAVLVSCSTENTQEYVDTTGNFSIQFKSEPTTSTESITFPFGTFQWKRASVEPEDDLNLLYAVSYLDLPKRVVTSDSLRLLTQLFALTQQDLLAKLGEAGFGSMANIHIHRYPGREFVWISKIEELGYTRRVYLVKNRLYLLEVQYKSNNQHNTDIEPFFASFGLLKHSTNVNPEVRAQKPKKKFTIDYPGEVQKREQELYGFFGPQIILSEMHETNDNKAPDRYGNVLYGVNYSCIANQQFQSASEAVKRKYLRNNLRATPLIMNGGKIISGQESTVSGRWCFEETAEILGGKAIIRSRIFFVDNYMYQLMVMSVPGSENNEASEAFMNSFQLTR
jgi:hypothetical protein